MTERKFNMIEGAVALIVLAAESLVIGWVLVTAVQFYPLHDYYGGAGSYAAMTVLVLVVLLAAFTALDYILFVRDNI